MYVNTSICPTLVTFFPDQSIERLIPQLHIDIWKESWYLMPYIVIYNHTFLVVFVNLGITQWCSSCNLSKCIVLMVKIAFVLPIGKLFWYKVHLSAHVRTHTKEHLHYCSKCNYSSITKNSLKRHLIQKHSGLLLSCSSPGCKYTTPDKYKLQTHQRTHQQEVTNL